MNAADVSGFIVLLAEIVVVFGFVAAVWRDFRD